MRIVRDNQYMKMSRRRCLAAGALLLAGCSQQKQESVFVDPVLTNLIPGDTDVVAGLRMEKLKKSSLWAKLAGGEGKEPEFLRRFRQKLGLSPRQEIWEALMCGAGEEHVTLLRGRFGETGFTTTGLMPRIQPPGSTPDRYKERELQTTGSFSFCLLGPTQALVGSRPRVRAVLDRLDSTTPGLSGSLLQTFQQIPYETEVWTAGKDLQAFLRMLHRANIGGFTSMPVAVNSMSAWVELNPQKVLRSRIVCAGIADAMKLKGALSMLAALPTSMPDIATKLEGSTLQLTAAIDEKQVEKLIASLAKTLEAA
jgi:hypothetical protein